MRFMKDSKRLLIASAIITIAIGLAACGTNTPTATAAGAASKPTITGTFTLSSMKNTDADTADAVTYDNFDEGGPNTGGCFGTNGYDDIISGLQVAVSNESDEVIGTGALGTGEIVSQDQFFADCRFSFTVQNLPVAKFYKITVGHRGELDYSYADLQAAGWSVGFTLGS